MQANLTNRDAVEVPKPYVKYSHEPPRAADVPFALAQAIHHASLPPTGPAFVSIPMDDWQREIEPVDYVTQIARTVGGRAQPDPAQRPAQLSKHLSLPAALRSRATMASALSCPGFPKTPMTYGAMITKIAVSAANTADSTAHSCQDSKFIQRPFLSRGI